jgi:hypothetical protein
MRTRFPAGYFFLSATEAAMPPTTKANTATYIKKLYPILVSSSLVVQAGENFIPTKIYHIFHPKKTTLSGYNRAGESTIEA